MASEVAVTDYSRDELNSSHGSSLTTQSLTRRNTSGQDSTEEQADVTPALRYSFFLTPNNSIRMHVCH